MMSVKVGVVGAGVVGLATAVNIQQRLPQAKVTIIADRFAKDTTSDGAGGLFRPTAEFLKGVPVDLVKQWISDSWEHFSAIAASADSGRYGVFPVSGYQLHNRELDPEYKEFTYSFRQLTNAELQKLGTLYRYGYAVTTIIAEPRKYMPLLMKKFKENKGQLENRTVKSLEEFVGVYDVVVNCSGLASKWLANDPIVYPVRGQLIRINAPWIKNWLYTDDSVHVIPVTGTVVIGGVRQKGSWDTSVSDVDRQGIFERACKMIPSIKDAEIVAEWAGLRPHRDPLRLEIETIRFKNGNLKVVHNYGHGSNGIALSWGTGMHASRLVQDCVDQISTKSLL